MGGDEPGFSGAHAASAAARGSRHLARQRRLFVACLRSFALLLGRLVECVSKRGELETTVVVFTSDHGEMVGDYNQWQKLSPLQASVGVPLVIAGPGVAAARRDNAPMTTLDLTASFLEGAGLFPGEDLDSRSLASYLGETGHRHRDLVFSGLSAWRMAFDGRFKLVRGYDPRKRVGGDVFEPMHIPPDEARRLQRDRPQLVYDLERNERDDVSSEFPEVLHRLGAALDGHLAY